MNRQAQGPWLRGERNPECPNCDEWLEREPVLELPGNVGIVITGSGVTNPSSMATTDTLRLLEAVPAIVSGALSALNGEGQQDLRDAMKRAGVLA